MTLSTTRLRSAIEAAAERIDGVLEVWLFGSALRSQRPRDIDLLVVYNASVLKPHVAASVRRPIAEAATAVTSLEAHIVVLSEQEATSTKFAETEGATLLYAHT